jgi:CRISPR-associated protein Cas2
MNTVIIYDISGNRRRARFHKFLKELGIPSQLSVFECRLDDRELRLIRRYCLKHLDQEEDSVRIYRICLLCMKKSKVLGLGITFSQLDWAIV